MYKFGIIGAGHRTSTLLLPALRNLEVASLVSICDTDYGALDKIKDKHSIRTYFDFKDMLSREKLDFVIAVTPHNVYKEIIETSVNVGVHILKEKPLSSSLEEGFYFNDISEGKIHIMTMLQRRAMPIYSNFIDLIQHVGKPFFIESKYARFIEKPYEGWRGKRDLVGGGCIIDMGYHMVDLLIWYFGLPEKVYATYTSKAVPKMQYYAEDTGNISFSYNDGLHGNLFVSKYYSPKTEFIKVVGSEGMIAINTEGIEILKPNGDKIGFIKNEITETDAVRSLIEVFCKVLRGETQNPSDPKYNLQHLAFVEACYKSADLNQPISPIKLLNRAK